MAPQSDNLQRFIRAAGMLHIVRGGLVLMGTIMLIIASRAGGLLPFQLEGWSAMYSLGLSVPGIIAGYGIYTFQPWAYRFGLLMSVLVMFALPLGPIVGAVGLIALLLPGASAPFMAEKIDALDAELDALVNADPPPSPKA